MVELDESTSKQDYKEITQRLRDEVKKLLENQDIRQIIGWKAGSYGFRVSPVFVDDIKDIDNLIWSPFCINSLAPYPTLEEKLPLPRGVAEDTRKIGVVVKGCDSRGLVQMFAEQGYPRDRIIVIGIPCTGQINPEKLLTKIEKLDETRITKNIAINDLEITDQGDSFKISYNQNTIEIPKLEIVYDKCINCKYPNPLINDMLLAAPVKPRGQGMIGYEKVTELSDMANNERWAYWAEKFDRCIRCYACRNICPVCYCKECLTDKWEPDWINKSVNLTENSMFQIMRGLHLAGRCIDCHECERACPVGIPLVEIYKSMEKVVLEQFGYEPGLDPEKLPVLSTFNPQDPGEFIL
jgi:ferredoxin